MGTKGWGWESENKGFDTRCKTSCDRSCYETLPCLLHLRDKRYVQDTESENESVWELKTEMNFLVWVSVLKGEKKMKGYIKQIAEIYKQKMAG